MPEKVKLPVVFHNLREHDGHIITQGLGKSLEGHKFSFIPNKMEKYMNFLVGRLSFIDSIQFLPFLLEQLTKGQKHNDLKIINKGLTTMAELELLKRKGVYPYD